MHPRRTGHHRRVDILVNGDGDTPRAAEYHQRAQKRIPLRRRQILFAQAEPPASTREHGVGDFFERPAGLLSIRDDE